MYHNFVCIYLFHDFNRSEFRERREAYEKEERRKSAWRRYANLSGLYRYAKASASCPVVEDKQLDEFLFNYVEPKSLRDHPPKHYLGQLSWEENIEYDVELFLQGKGLPSVFLHIKRQIDNHPEWRWMYCKNDHDNLESPKSWQDINRDRVVRWKNPDPDMSIASSVYDSSSNASASNERPVNSKKQAYLSKLKEQELQWQEDNEKRWCMAKKYYSKVSDGRQNLMSKILMLKDEMYKEQKIKRLVRKKKRERKKYRRVLNVSERFKEYIKRQQSARRHGRRLQWKSQLESSSWESDVKARQIREAKFLENCRCDALFDYKYTIPTARTYDQFTGMPSRESTLEQDLDSNVASFQNTNEKQKANSVAGMPAQLSELKCFESNVELPWEGSRQFVPKAPSSVSSGTDVGFELWREQEQNKVFKSKRRRYQSQQAKFKRKYIENKAKDVEKELKDFAKRRARRLRQLRKENQCFLPSSMWVLPEGRLTARQIVFMIKKGQLIKIFSFRLH